jgi:hypothetical protein
MGKINGENVAGAAFLFLAGLFLAAGIMNPIIASVAIVFYLIAAIGAGLVFLGYMTYRSEVSSSERKAEVQHI